MPPTSKGTRRDADPLGRPTAQDSTGPRRRGAPSPDTADDPDAVGGSAELEPLAASWQPVLADEPTSAEAEDDTRGLRSIHRRLGWRLYAVPLLMIVTVVVVLDVLRTPADSAAVADGGDPATSEPGGAGGPTTGSEEEPTPVEPVDVDIANAELPEGDAFATSGSGEFRLLAGTTDVVGEAGDLHTYTVEIEDGLDVAADEDVFSSMVDQTLADPRSWPGQGEITMRRVDDSGAAPDLRITLVSQQTAAAACGDVLPFEVSCLVAEGDAHRAYLNAARWTRGAHSYESNLADFRHYMVNHEVGHHLGLRHVACGTDGELARVMMDQSISLADEELSLLGRAGGIEEPVPDGGAVCRPNAWPYPVIDAN
ncbi:hypothetical protein FHR81_002983 [Actinoalloteichus hoggarensis]|uniref:DUF3152 domain-containing protein n=1 Tax=Actinoalloteichus hoggarensis TaxID=1470176 RepID=UPI000B8B383D|nr:DUF3152 domain-containing protein [Actinoalloteichus hoggarensis]MBB5921943.1 hypothetical protein [Actinoalloteichus hoggarensis]